MKAVGLSVEELKQVFLQERIDFWKKHNNTPKEKAIIKELELIQIIIGKPSVSGKQKGEK